MKTMRVAALVVLIAASALALVAARAQNVVPGVSHTDLQRHDISIPGHEAYQIRVDFDPGASFPKHTHPGEEVIYVLAGALEYDIEGQPPVTLKTGDVIFIPAGTVHAAKNVGSGPASELATYILEKGKPPLTIVK
ncbi:MAG TPA: cupin domain-containing protein [Xanthobacteraceae bacterium]|jgi:quercetin dioxygenase-like cupin family protein|nr:cupin domain-containing protein [Xanthobacteraceae bacterium]